MIVSQVVETDAGLPASVATAATGAAGDVVSERDGARPSARAAFERFFRTHHQDLARLAYALTGDHADADDIAADAFVEAWRRWDRIEAADYPVAYVRRILVNLAADRIRRAVRDRRGRRLLSPLGSWVHNPDVGARLDLQSVILRLPPRRRACVVLRHVYDLPIAEVAQALGISEGAAKSQTSKGLAQLRQVLEAAGGAYSGPSPGRLGARTQEVAE